MPSPVSVGTEKRWMGVSPSKNHGANSRSFSSLLPKPPVARMTTGALTWVCPPGSSAMTPVMAPLSSVQQVAGGVLGEDLHV